MKYLTFLVIIVCVLSCNQSTFLSKQRQIYRYNSDDISITISTDAEKISSNDSVLVNILLENNSDNTFWLFDFNKTVHYYIPTLNIITIDYGELFSSTIETEITLIGFKPKQRVTLNHIITYSDVSEYLEDQEFNIEFGIGYVPSIEILEENRNYSNSDIIIENNKVIASSIVVEFSLKKLHVGGIKIIQK